MMGGFTKGEVAMTHVVYGLHFALYRMTVITLLCIIVQTCESTSD